MHSCFPNGVRKSARICSSPTCVPDALVAPTPPRQFLTHSKAITTPSSTPRTLAPHSDEPSSPQTNKTSLLARLDHLTLCSPRRPARDWRGGRAHRVGAGPRETCGGPAVPRLAPQAPVWPAPGAPGASRARAMQGQGPGGELRGMW